MDKNQVYVEAERSLCRVQQLYHALLSAVSLVYSHVVIACELFLTVGSSGLV